MALLITLLLATCECEGATAEQRAERADVVFRGEITNLSENVEGCGSTGTWNVSIRVLEVYKGSVAERVNVQSQPPDEDACAFPIERDRELLVYARALENFREYESDRCMGTAWVEEAQADLALLGPGVPPGNVGCGAVEVGGVWLALGLAALLRATRRRVAPASAS